MARSFRFSSNNTGMSNHVSKEEIAGAAKKARAEFGTFFEKKGFASVKEDGPDNKLKYVKGDSAVLLFAQFDGYEGRGFRNSAIVIEVKFEGKLASADCDTTIFEELAGHVSTSQVLATEFQPPFALLSRTVPIESGGTLHY